MKTNSTKKSETIKEVLYYAALSSPFLFLVLLSVFAVQERSYQIFLDFWWIIILTTILAVVSTRFFNNVRIDYENKTVVIMDRSERITVRQGELKEISLKGSINSHLKILYSDNNQIKEHIMGRWLLYTENGKKKIIDALLAFNPEAKRSYVR